MAGSPIREANISAPSWLSTSLLDEQPAMYPYAQLRNILTPGDVPSAIGDECALLEQEFGTEAIRPFYHLVWLLNTLPSLFTIQTQVAPCDLKPPYDWARTQVASQIIMLSRNPAVHTHRGAAEAVNSWLFRLISARAARQQPNATGWLITVGSTPVILLRLRTPDAPYPYRDEDLIEEARFGSVLRLRGCANSRTKAAGRWQAAVTFITSIIEREQAHNGLGKVDPYRHLQNPPS